MRLAWALVALLALGGCTAPTREEAVPFELQVTPADMAESVPGQWLVFMVAVDSEDQAPVALSATVNGQAVEVVPDRLAPGRLAELAVPIEPAHSGSTLVLVVEANRDDRVTTTAVEIPVVGDVGEPPLDAATEVRERFVAWLAEAHPELGIDEQTEWRASVARPVWLVVSYYTFYSDDWEMGVRWHIMIPPYDWGEIYLRERYEETEPGLAWKVDSRSDPASIPYAVEPEPAVWR